MSFYSDASLVMIPSGYKDQKVYCAVPTDGLGDLTFSRASSATRVQSDGLIEKVRTNLILQSQTFDNASWTKYEGATITANSTTAPDGTLTAETLNVATNIFSGTYQAISLSSNIYTISIFVKKGTKDFIYLFDASATAQGWFNLTNGTLGSIPVGYNASIISVGDGWFKISFGNKNAVTPAFFQLGLSDADGVSLPASTGTAFIWGAQLETGDIATDYIATTTAAVSVGPVSGLPRLDYLGSTCPRLLLEPQRSNLALYSEQFNNASVWGGTAVVTANNAVSPDGYTNADQINPSSLASASLNNNLAPVAITAGTAYTISLFVKNSNFGASDYITFNTTDNVASELLGRIYPSTQTISNLSGTGSPAWSSISSSVVNYGNGWYRYSITATAGSNSGAAVTYLTMSKSCWFYGFMFEAGAYATSYIPTLGASVTRVADVTTKTGISSLIGSTEGVLFVEADMTLNSANGRVFMDVNDNDLTNRVAISISNNVVGGFVQGATRVSYTIPSSGRYKIAFGYKSGDFVLYVNGVQRSTSTASVTFSGMNQIFLGHTFAGTTTQPSDPIAQTLLFKTRLTNAQLAELTTL
jgi:hypothetical protein